MDPTAKSIKIEAPDPPSGEPESYCRFCYGKEYELVSIFPATGLPLQHIIDLLDTLTGIQLNVTEDLPSAICSQCLSKLQEFDHFRRKCKIYNDEVKRFRAQWNDCQSAYVKNEDIPDEVEDFTPINESMCDGQDVNTEEISPEVETGIPNNRRKRSLDKTGRYRPRMGKLKKLTGINNKQQKPKVAELSPKVASRTSNDQKKRSPNKTTKSKLLKGKLKKLSSIKSKQQKRKVRQKDYRCRICLDFFTDTWSIHTHLNSHTDTVNRRCLQCSRRFRSENGLAVHMRTSYVQTSFSCKYCDVLFKTKETLYAHELNCDQETQKTKISEAPTKPRQCALCQKSFQNKILLRKHMTLHEVKFPCVKCGVNLPSACLLNNHNERYHSKGEDQIATVVRCEPCQRTFVDVSAYRSHNTRIHHGQESLKPNEDKMYECDHCDKRFWSINTIRYHVLVHRQYRDCDQCSDSFRSSQELRAHKSAAHSVKCEFCSKQFFSKRICRSHSNRKHGMLQIKILAKGDRKVSYEWRKLVFKCACCGQDYGTYRELQDHYREMHPGSSLEIECLYCNRNSTSRIGYIGHLTRNCGQTPKKVQAWN